MSMKPLTTKQFIEKAIKIHGNRYDYSKSEYKGSLIKLIIICPKHGEFLQSPANHLQGQNCRKCYIDSLKKEKNLIELNKKKREADKKYRLKHLQLLKKCQRLYYNKNKIKISQHHKNYNIKHKTEIKLRQKKYNIFHKKDIKKTIRI